MTISSRERTLLDQLEKLGIVVPRLGALHYKAGPEGILIPWLIKTLYEEENDAIFLTLSHVFNNANLRDYFINIYELLISNSDDPSRSYMLAQVLATLMSSQTIGYAPTILALLKHEDSKAVFLHIIRRLYRHLHPPFWQSIEQFLESEHHHLRLATIRLLSKSPYPKQRAKAEAVAKLGGNDAIRKLTKNIFR